MIAVTGPGRTRSAAEMVDRCRNKTLGGLDKTALEQYLDDKDFAAVLGMSRAEFSGLPKWKSDN